MHFMSMILYLVVYCTQCYEIFSDRKLLVSHQIKVHDRQMSNINDNKKNKLYFCNIESCNKSYLSQHNLNRHKLTHSKPFKCNFNKNLCNKSFSTHWDLKMHLRIHSNLKLEKCNFCKLSFTNPSTLRKHKQYVHKNGVNEKEFICKKCHKRFSRKESLMRHLEKVHNHNDNNKNKIIHKCNLCLTTFKYKYNLNRHLRDYH